MRKKIFIFFIVLLGFIGIVIPNVNAEVMEPGYDVTNDWEILNYSSDLSIPLEEIFVQGKVRPGTEIHYLSNSFFNIGNGELDAQRVLHLKGGRIYYLKFLYGLVKTNNALGNDADVHVNFNGTDYEATYEALADQVHQETIVAESDMDYVISINYIAPRDTGMSIMVGYDAADIDGGVHYENIEKIVYVNYFDEEGNTLKESEIIKGKKDETYEIENSEIEGYELTNPDVLTGVFTEDEASVNLIFSKKEIQMGLLEVQYLDEKGNSIAESKTIEGAIDSKYNVNTPEYKINIDGYSLSEETLPDNMEGVYSIDKTTVTFTYGKIAEELPEVELPEEEKTTTDDSTPINNLEHGDDQQNKGHQSESKKVLPQTGEKENPYIIIVCGLFLFVLVCLMIKQVNSKNKSNYSE